MNDLEKLIRQRQDELRGRPEDWIDRLVAWSGGQDWLGNIILAIGTVSAIVSFGLLFFHGSAE